MSSPFASQSKSEPIPLPFDPPNWVVVRKLTGRESDACQETHRGSLASGSPRTWASTFRRALEKGATDPQVLQALHDPLTGYDRFAVVRAGLLAWSYPLSVTKTTTTATGTTAISVVDAVDDLDDEAVDFIATEVLRLTKPALFLASEEDAATAQKELPVAAPTA